MVCPIYPECQGERGLSAREKAARFAPRTVYGALALALPGFIVFGRGALGVALGIAVVAMTAAAAAGLRWRLWEGPVRPAVAIAGVLALAWLPAVVGSVSPGVSALTVLRTVAMIAGGAALVAFAARDESGWALRVFVVGMLTAQVFAVIALFVTPEVAFFRARGGIVIPRFALKASASAIACALPVLIYAGWRLRGRWVWAVALCLPLGLGIIYGTSSRSSLAGMLAALVLCGIVAATRARPVRHLLMGVTVALAVAVGGVTTALHWTIPDTSGGYTMFAPIWLVDQHRQVIWQFTLDRFQERPWFGWGINAITTVPGASDIIPEMTGAEFIPSHPHNWMVEALAESGIAGFVPLLAIILGVAVVAIRNYRRGGNPATLAWMALWLTYWSAGAFNFSMWNATWQSSGLALAALVAGRRSGNTGS